MHTDEFEISLGRELAVCEQYVRKCRKLIAGMEARQERTPEGSREWEQARAELRHWSAARDEYAQLLAEMRQSAPQ
jgi:hypothetical protein